MAVTAALVNASANRLRYLLTSDAGGGAFVIPNDAGATPDLQTDAPAGPLRQIALARTNGIGTIAAGTVLSAGQSRALLLSDGTVSVGSATCPRARCTIAPRTGATAWIVDATVDGAGDPTITATASAAAGTAYLDVEAPASIG